MATNFHLFTLPETAKWRAKLYRLGNDRWHLVGEGKIYGENNNTNNDYYLLVEDDDDPDRIIFKSAIRSPLAFQKQDALLLWNGPESDIIAESSDTDGEEVEYWKDENDFARVAIEFQVIPGCALMSEYILYAISQLENPQDVGFAVQGAHPALEGSYAEGLADVISRPIEYPPMPSRWNLELVQRTIVEMLGSSLGRELLIIYMATCDYLDHLWDLFQELNNIPQSPSGRSPSEIDPVPSNTLNSYHGATSFDTPHEFTPYEFKESDSVEDGGEEPGPDAGDAPSVMNVSALDASLADSSASAMDSSMDESEVHAETRDAEEFQKLEAELERRRHAVPITPQEKVQLMWMISDILKLYMSAGDSLLIQRMIDSCTFSKVLTMLEYDRSFGNRKANFQAFYSQQTSMRHVLELIDSPVTEKIQRTFRLQMLRDILVRGSEEATFSVLRHLIDVNHADVLENLQNSPAFCKELFSVYDASHDFPLYDVTKTRDDAVAFVNEVMRVAKTFFTVMLRPMYLRLLESGLFKSIMYGLQAGCSKEIKLLTLDTLAIIFEIDSHLMAQKNDASVALAILERAFDAPEGDMDHPTERAVRLGATELIKRLLADHPHDLNDRFFAFASDIFGPGEEEAEAESGSGSGPSNPSKLATCLDILVHCFANHAGLTGGQMVEHGLWPSIATHYARALASKNRVWKSKLTILVTKLLREATQPLASVETSVVAKQAVRITESGLLGSLVNHILGKKRINDAEHSSFLSLLHVIVDGRIHSSARQYKIINRWLAAGEGFDLLELHRMYPFVQRAIPLNLRSASHKETGGSAEPGEAAETGEPVDDSSEQVPSLERKRSVSHKMSSFDEESQQLSSRLKMNEDDSPFERDYRMPSEGAEDKVLVISNRDFPNRDLPNRDLPNRDLPKSNLPRPEGINSPTDSPSSPPFRPVSPTNAIYPAVSPTTSSSGSDGSSGSGSGSGSGSSGSDSGHGSDGSGDSRSLSGSSSSPISSGSPNGAASLNAGSSPSTGNSQNAGKERRTGSMKGSLRKPWWDSHSRQIKALGSSDDGPDSRILVSPVGSPESLRES